MAGQDYEGQAHARRAYEEKFKKLLASGQIRKCSGHIVYGETNTRFGKNEYCNSCRDVSPGAVVGSCCDNYVWVSTGKPY